jgi:hypothetical protein
LHFIRLGAIDRDDRKHSTRAPTALKKGYIMYRFIPARSLLLPSPACATPQRKLNSGGNGGCSLAKIAMIAILLSTALFAQQKSVRSKSAPATVASGTLSGRVFLITASGDLKPARLATIILLYSGRTPDQAEAEPNTAGMKFAEELVQAQTIQLKAEIAERNRTRPAEDEERFERRMCRTALQVYSQAALTTLNWLGTEGNKSHQVVNAEADEEGNFKIVAPQGSYILLAHGRAGFNDAAWWASVGVKSGEVVTVKLPNPAKACLDTTR